MIDSDLQFSQMNKPQIQTPKNTTKRTGIGCSAIGFLSFITAVCIFIAGLIFRLEHTYIAIGMTLLAFGIISLIGGIGLFFKGRQVDKMLSGEDLIARWNYLVDENGKRKTGYVYIGTKGFYKDGLYIFWSNKCVLQDVVFQQGTPATITFRYLRIGSYKTGSMQSQNNSPVPVPSDKYEEAMQVVKYYKNRLQKNNVA